MASDDDRNLVKVWTGRLTITTVLVVIMLMLAFSYAYP